MGLILAEPNKVTTLTPAEQDVLSQFEKAYTSMMSVYTHVAGTLIFKTTQAVLDRAECEHLAKFRTNKPLRLKIFRGIAIEVDNEMPADTIYLMPK